MWIAVLVLLIIALAGYCLYVNDNLSKEKKKVIVLNSQLNLQHLKGDGKKFLNIEIRYTKPGYTQGKIMKDSSYYLGPVETIAIGTLPKDFDVEILDQAFVKDIPWYYVSFKTPNHTNNKGWIKGDEIVFDITSPVQESSKAKPKTQEKPLEEAVSSEEV